MKEFSDISNIKYDFVLLTRIDCLFKKEIDFSNLNNNMFYTSFRKGRKDEGIALYDFFFYQVKNLLRIFRVYIVMFITIQLGLPFPQWSMH